MLESPHLLRGFAYLLPNESDGFSYSTYTEHDLSFLAQYVMPQVAYLSPFQFLLNLLNLAGHTAVLRFFLQK